MTNILHSLQPVRDTHVLTGFWTQKHLKSSTQALICNHMHIFFSLSYPKSPLQVPVHLRMSSQVFSSFNTKQQPACISRGLGETDTFATGEAHRPEPKKGRELNGDKRCTFLPLRNVSKLNFNKTKR